MKSVDINEGFAVPKNSGAERFHYMDNLRALAMMLGILFHAALAYSPLMNDLWLGSDQVNSPVIDIVAWFTHMFRMPLFFAVSGFFALMLLNRRGVAGFIKHRSLRILLPLIIFLPLVLVAIVFAIGWGTEHVQNKSPMLGMIAYFQTLPEAPEPPLSTTHLWFLYNLFMFCLIAAVVHKIGLFKQVWLEKVVASRGFILAVLPLLMLPGYYSVAAPHPAAEQVYPELWSFGTNGMFFFMGMLLFLNQSLIEKCRALSIPLLLVSLAAYAWFYLHLPEKMSLQQAMAPVPEGFSWFHLGQSAVEAFVGTYMTIVCLVVGQRCLNGANKVLKFVADSSYWVYIIHLPLLFFIQFLLLDLSLNLWLKFLISVGATLIIGFVSYALLVRSTPLGILLNGKRYPLGK